MLLRHVQDGVLAISQPSHAWIAGELARAWGGINFAVPAPYDQVIAATTLHDIGWIDWEIAPRLNSRSGLPFEFQDVPAEVHTALWDQGVKHAYAYGNWVALLISRHGDAIYDLTFDPMTARPEAAEVVDRFLRNQRETQARLIDGIVSAEAGALCSNEHLDVIKAFIVAVDTLSLHVCRGITSVTTIGNVPDRSGGLVQLTLNPSKDGIDIAPWPFVNSKSFDVSVEGRLLTKCVESQRELDSTLSTAIFANCRMTLRSAG